MTTKNFKFFHVAVLAFALSASSCQMLQSLMPMLGPLLGGVAGGLVDESDGGSAMSLTGGGSGNQSGYKVVSALGQEDDGKLYGMYSAGR